jgi:hypothetical protein
MTVEGTTSALRRASRVVVPLDPMEIFMGSAPAITLAAAMRDLKLLGAPFCRPRSEYLRFVDLTTDLTGRSPAGSPT